MRAEIVQKELWILPETEKDVWSLIQWGASTDPKDLPERLVLNIAPQLRGVAEWPKKEAEAPEVPQGEEAQEERTPAPPHIQEAAKAGRDALVEEALALGARPEDLKGKREKSLQDIIAKLKAMPEPPANVEALNAPEETVEEVKAEEPTPAPAPEKPSANKLEEAAKPNGAIPAPTYEQCLNLGRDYINAHDEAGKPGAKERVKGAIPSGKGALAECGPEERSAFFKAVEAMIQTLNAAKTDGGDDF